MKIHKNILNDEVLLSARAALQFKFYENCWSNTQTNPQAELRKFTTGPTLTAPISGEIAEAITESISPFIPECDELSLSFEVISPTSGRSKHVDAILSFTGFIPLNEVWDPSSGGILVWWPTDSVWDEESSEPSNEDPVRAMAPAYNTLILNDQKEWYLITPVAATSPSPLVGIKVEGKFTRDGSN